MRKMMFNDKYGLTESVIDKTKTQTRRIVNQNILDKVNNYIEFYGTYNNTIEDLIYKMVFFDNRIKPTYCVNDIVAVAMCYGNCGTWFFPYSEYGHLPGYTNKMFVSAELMPYRIKITNVRVEKLNDISDEDCMKEGIVGLFECGYRSYTFKGSKKQYLTPRDAYAALIDKISGKGTWKRNPYVFVYDFKLVD